MRSASSEIKLNLLNDLMSEINKIQLTGIKNIKGIYRVSNLNIFRTTGINLLKIYKNVHIVKKYLDENKILSNHLYEVYQLFGIEAARLLLINEIKLVMNSNGIKNINDGFYQMYADLITMEGFPVPLTHKGISKASNKIGPTQKLSFERFKETITNVSAYSEEDNIKSSSAALLYGSQPEYGTNMFNIKIKI